MGWWGEGGDSSRPSCRIISHGKFFCMNLWESDRRRRGGEARERKAKRVVDPDERRRDERHDQVVLNVFHLCGRQPVFFHLCGRQPVFFWSNVWARQLGWCATMHYCCQRKPKLSLLERRLDVSQFSHSGMVRSGGMLRCRHYCWVPTTKHRAIDGATRWLYTQRLHAQKVVYPSALTSVVLPRLRV